MRRATLAIALLSAVTTCGRAPDAPSSGPRILWTHTDAEGARSLPYADDSVAVFMNAFTPRVSELNAADGSVRWQVGLQGVPATLALPQANIVRFRDVLIVAAWQLEALDRATGQLRWSFGGDSDYAAGSSVAIDGDQVISPGSATNLYAVDALTGAELWRIGLGERPFAPVVDQGVAYIGAKGYIRNTNTLGAGHVFAVRTKDGHIMWSTFIPDAPNGSWLGGTDHAGALTSDLFIVSSTNGSVYGLDRQTGNIRWQYQARAPMQSGVAVLNGIAVVAALNGDIIGLDAESGALRWQTSTGGSSVIYQVTSDAGCAYIAVGSLICVDDTGQIRWQTGGASAGGPNYVTPVRSVGARLFAGSQQGFNALAP